MNTGNNKLIIITILILVLSNAIFAKEFAPLDNPKLDKYCTSCHMVYQAGFLPKRSWELMFKKTSLKDHFGDDVDIPADKIKLFLDYYLKEASDITNAKSSKKINKSINPDKTPLWITGVPKLEDIHEDLTIQMVEKNKDVEKIGNCVACHDKNAKKGIYDEDDVDVPNYKNTIFGWSKK